ncbi:GyrI-like domain-containing protein [Psychrilyobacter atlanticus]|uniref:GyrI-like domain-containing protein n=1 Tax=Psychrilyobacter atlanticus TaxID=271091 RepID=UPI00040AECE3|nr:GyrI-like domain-containing protein [Psychrilyobacter atlanticus]
MKFENVEFKEQKCFGIEEHITTTNKKEGLINNLWMTFVESIDYKAAGALYGVSKNFDITTQEFDYSACADINTPILKEFTRKDITIPGGKYAKFSSKGIMNDKTIEKFYTDVFTFTMVGGEITPDMERGINSFELYDESYLGIDNPESVYYLLIPIK